MGRPRLRMLAGGALAVLVALATPAGALSPSATVTTAIQGWERYVRIEWTTTAQPNGQLIYGHVYNTYGSPIADVQLLTQGLDGAGNLVHQKLTWVHGQVPGFQRVYFQIPPMPQADRYRVTVWAFNVLESKSFP